MGYAMFASRKISLVDRVNKTQLELTQISNKISDLADLGAALGDGNVTSSDIANCQQYLGTLGAFEAKAETSKYSDPGFYWGLHEAGKEGRQQPGVSKGGLFGGAGIGGILGGIVGGVPGALIGGALGGLFGNKAGKSLKAKKEYAEQYEQKQREQMAEELQEKIAKLENELEKKKNTLETKLQAYNTELESVKQAESQGIKNATPNYAGGGGGR